MWLGRENEFLRSETFWVRERDFNGLLRSQRLMGCHANHPPPSSPIPETPGFLRHLTPAMIGKGDVACGLDVSVLLSGAFHGIPKNDYMRRRRLAHFTAAATSTRSTPK